MEKVPSRAPRIVLTTTTENSASPLGGPAGDPTVIKKNLPQKKETLKLPGTRLQL